MSAWKQFLASDLIVAPFLVNKGFSFPYTQWITSSNGESVGIERFYGENIPWNVNYSSNQTTGIGQVEYTALIYNSIKQLYYSNFLYSSSGDPVNLRVLVPGAGPSGSGDTFIGSGISGSGPLYDNFLQSTLTPQRYWNNSEIVVLSIPSKIFGEYIAPSSFQWTCGTPGAQGTIIDDGEGNLFSGSTNVGNIVYPQGLAVLTYTGSIFGEDLAFWSSEVNMTCSFSSSMTIYETQYKCTIQPSEFNATLNPSAQASGSTFEWTGSYFYEPGNGQLLDALTGSYFAPYVTTVGLYDEAQNLIAVGKLSQPLPTSQTTDTTILVNLDF
jgi:hypothetical protein